MRKLCLFFLACALAGCAPAAAPSAIPAAAEPSLPPTATPTTRAAPAAAPTPLSTGAQATPAQKPALCSPLDGFALDNLPALVTNPYHPPPPGGDDPHTGVDLADAQNPNRVALAGRGVLAALPGTVAAVTANRFPFGNAIIIETPTSSLPPEWAAALRLPALRGQALAPISLTCPALALPPGADLGRPGLYVLYAHLQDAPALQPGDQVACGQQLGKIGQSGNALNPHLHFEVRVGPGGTRLGPFAHYDASATPAEIESYCLWTVSGFFELVDPLAVLELNEKSTR